MVILHDLSINLQISRSIIHGKPIVKRECSLSLSLSLSLSHAHTPHKEPAYPGLISLNIVQPL